MLSSCRISDLVSARDEAGQVIVDRVGEPQPAFGDELEHDRRREGLRHAADPEPLARARPAAPAGRRVFAVVRRQRRRSRSRRRTPRAVPPPASTGGGGVVLSSPPQPDGDEEREDES